MAVFRSGIVDPPSPRRHWKCVRLAGPRDEAMLPAARRSTLNYELAWPVSAHNERHRTGQTGGVEVFMREPTNVRFVPTADIMRKLSEGLLSLLTTDRGAGTRR
jgi:hypothetical protein